MADRNIGEFGFRDRIRNVEGMEVYLPVSHVFKSKIKVVPAKIDPFATDTVQQYPLGTELRHGLRRFRYALNGGSSIAVAKLVQSVVPLAGHIDEVVDEPAAGSTTIAFTPNTVTTDDLAENELADGYLYINDDTGEGYMHQIKSHPAIVGGTSGTITLVDPIVVTLGANATATVLHNPYRKVIIHPSPPTAPVMGVTVAAVGANEFCWLQVYGPCPVLIDGTVVIAQEVMPSTNTDGAVMALGFTEGTPNVTIAPPCGVVLAVNATTEHGAIWLNLPNT